MNPPIKYYGSKSTCSKWILGVMKKYTFDAYIEPFGGSGAVLFAKKPSKLEVYNDIDSNVVNLYEVIRSPKTFDQFQRLVELTPYSREAFQKAEESLTDENTDNIERAANFFVLATQGFNGVQKDKNYWSYQIKAQTSYKTKEYINRVAGLQEVHERLRTVQIEHLDAVECIKRYATKDTLIYADPPYLFKTRASNRHRYQYEFDRVKYERLLDVLRKTPAHVILSAYDDDFLYRPLTNKGWKRYQKHTLAMCTQLKNYKGKKQPRERTECLYCSPTGGLDANYENNNVSRQNTERRVDLR